MSIDEKKDKKIFDKVIDDIKKSYKEKRQRLFKENYLQAQSEIKRRAEKRANRIIIISRKCEPPFHVTKKKEKEEIDYDLIRQNEDEELLTY